MTRNKKNTTALTLRIDVDLLAELQSINPALLTVDPNTKKPKFRHGALGRYVSRLIREDIYQRKSIKDMSLEEIVDSIETGETGSGRYEVVSYTPDTYTVDRKEDETDDEYTDRVQKESKRTPQGQCESTLTERYANPDCTCNTYPGNLGPCKTFEEGASGACVYCDHSEGCHNE